MENNISCFTWIALILTGLLIVLVFLYYSFFYDNDKFYIRQHNAIGIFKVVTIFGVVISIICAFITDKQEESIIAAYATGFLSTILIIIEKTTLYDKRQYIFWKKINQIKNEYEPNNRIINDYISEFLDQVEINIKKINTHIRERNILPEKKCTDESLATFMRYNSKNTHNYLFLAYHNERISNELFSNIFFNIYKKVSDDFLSPLISKRETVVPEFVANELGDAILKMNGVKSQYNTSIFKFDEFYRIHRISIESTTAIDSKRIFIYDENDFLLSFENNKTEKINGLQGLTKNMDIPLILWLIEWHANHGWKVGFINKNEAKRIQKGKIADIESLDFSVIHIENITHQANSSISYDDIVLTVKDISHDKTFYHIGINYYALTASREGYAKDETLQKAKHLNFFEELWTKKDNDIEKKIKRSTFYINLPPDKRENIDKWIKSSFKENNNVAKNNPSQPNHRNTVYRNEKK